MDYLKESDLNINYSHWKSELKEKFFLFPLLSLYKKLQGIQLKSNSQITRIDFELEEKESFLLFKDLINGKTFKLDLSELSDNKISFSGQSDIKEYWIRQPIEKASDWL